ncbi:probable prolyl endopeptidase [Coccomyxa sp. Obi]|nr:probable prolyl endopeptidase [Coccomyxa sp. Obi]
MQALLAPNKRYCARVPNLWKAASWWSSIFDVAGPPSIPPSTDQRVVHGQSINDEYRFLESNGEQLQQHLQREQRYCRDSFHAIRALQEQLRNEMLDQCPDRVESPPEALGTYQYFTRATPTRPLPCYLRRQSSGPEEVLLDMNNLDTEGSLGQMKISRSQRFLAYTLEKEPGSETYMAYVDDLHAGTTVDIIPDVHGIEFAGDDKSILYTASDTSAVVP